jgi:hypothetical protein
VSSHGHAARLWRVHRMKKCSPRPVLRSTVSYQNKTIDANLCRNANFTSAKGH